jgi:menaquinone-dependent protoporphyrinogen oxidase
MKPTLLIYATREGHTRRISEHLCELLQKEQHPCRLMNAVNATEAPASLMFSDYSSAILAASLHYGKFEPEMVALVKQHVAQLENLPTLFLSVSNAERAVEDPKSTEESRAGAQAIVKSTTDRFLAETGWRPTQIAAAAGALQYSKYGILTRFMMKMIAKSSGAPTDTSKDYVFTDWEKLDRMVEEFESAVA